MNDNTRTLRLGFTLALVFAMVFVVVAVAVPPRGGQGGGGAGYGPGAGCIPCQGLDVAAAQTVAGTAVSLTGGRGQGAPTLALTVGGETLSILVGPYRLWAGAGFTVEAGRELSVTYATCGQGALVALAVSDEATGKTIQLRDPQTGLPLGGRRR